MVPLPKNLQQDTLMAFYHSLAYEASAGSGKTFALVIRYISLLYLGAKPATILTLTFTNKAAGEMQERISTVLSQLHLPSREAERKAIARTLEISEEEIIAKRPHIHKTYLESDLKISTIDKFFGQIVRLFSQHLGIMPDFTIEEKRDELSFLLHFLENAQKSGLYKDLVHFSAREQKRLKDIFDFLSSLYTKDAEMQSFKTKLQHYEPPKEHEILTRVSQLRTLFDDNCPNLSDRAKQTLNDINSIQDILAKSWICKDSFNYWDYRRCYQPAMDDLLHRIRTDLVHYFTQRDSYLLSKYFQLFDLYKETLLQENIASNTLTFNDVTNLLFRLMHEKIDRDFLYFRLDAHIDHLLIDEFQDTNIIQYKILAPIIEEIHAGEGTSGFTSFFYVGDIKQSIYRFRGGQKELFHFIRQHYGVTLKQLDTNYRSDCNLVTFVNDTFRDVIEGYHDQKCADNSSGGFISIRTKEDICEGVVDALFQLRENGVSPDEIAILTLTNDAAFEIEEALLQRDPELKITTQTSAKLINQQYVSALIEALKYLYFGAPVSKASMLALSGYHWNSELTLNELKKNEEPVELVKKVIEKLKLPASDPNITKLLDLISTYSDIEAFLFECEELSTEAPSKKHEGVRIMTIHKSKGLEFAHVILTDRFKRKNSDSGTLIFHYDKIDLKEIYIRTSNRDCIDPSYKEANDKQKELSHEDELNLLYVACTRAKHSLTIIKKEKNSIFAPLNLEDGEIGTCRPSNRHKEDTTESSSLDYQAITLGLQEQKSANEKSDKDDIYAINYGNALHYMLELLEGFCTDDIDNAYWAMKNRYEQLLRDGDSDTIKKRVARLLENDQFMQLVSGQISKEQPLIYNGERKQIDLLIEKENGYIVIDYKSSEQLRSEHKTQVRHYKKAVEEITGKPTTAYLCYIRAEEIALHEVD
jgi:ATP-dependent exoDNAse (exonuclease V) beta subunit